MELTAVKRKLFCVILAAAMFITGMCFAGEEADAWFAYQENSDCTSTNIISATLPQSTQNDAEEISGVRMAMDRVTATGKALERNPVRIGLILLFLAFLLENTHYLMEIRRLFAKNSTNSKDVIIRYIHRQDGLKD